MLPKMQFCLNQLNGFTALYLTLSIPKRFKKIKENSPVMNEKSGIIVENSLTIKPTIVTSNLFTNQ